MASFEVHEQNSDNTEDPESPLVHKKETQSTHINKKFWLVVAIFIGCILATAFITKAIVDNQTKLSSTQKPPKNLIIIISDGMGQTFNTAYRSYKKLNKTIIDKHFKGRYSTTPSNPNGITDSTASATAFACGIQTRNKFIGIDNNANPKGSILAAAKRKGKGTGIVVTSSVTHGTPASFSTNVLDRWWHELISKKQATRQINGKPMIDVLFGGGKSYFDSWGFFENRSIWHDEYGWNKVTGNAQEFIDEIEDIDISEMPYMGLFASTDYPFYLDRINVNDSSIQFPNLLQMTKKGINLLSTKYEKEGFIMLVEASAVDWCAHFNDIVCLLSEMDELTQTLEYVLNWAENDGSTLVVKLSDHETGGLSLGRDASFIRSKMVNYWDDRMPLNWNISGSWGSFDYDYSISAPGPVHDDIEHYGPYKWIPDAIKNSTHTAQYLMLLLNVPSDDSITSPEQLYNSLETMYLGGYNEKLSQLEKEFMLSIFNKSASVQMRAIAMLMNARTLTGWSSHSHTASDCAVYAFGPKENEFIGHWNSYEIGQLLTKVFDVENEQAIETEYIQQLFANGELKLCDPTIKRDYQSYQEWNESVTFPEGNLLYPDVKCVDQWMI